MRAAPVLKVRRAMRPDEVASLSLLAQCTFLPASPDKRFVRQMHGARELTESQAAYLQRCLHRYRRQLGRCLRIDCPECW